MNECCETCECVETEPVVGSEVETVVETPKKKRASKPRKPAGSLSRGAEKICASLLSAGCGLTVEEIVVATEYEKATVVARLSELKRAGRIAGEGYKPRRYSVVVVEEKAAE